MVHAQILLHPRCLYGKTSLEFHLCQQITRLHLNDQLLLGELTGALVNRTFSIIVCSSFCTCNPSYRFHVPLLSRDLCKGSLLQRFTSMCVRSDWSKLTWTPQGSRTMTSASRAMLAPHAVSHLSSRENPCREIGTVHGTTTVGVWSGSHASTL